MDFKLLGPLEVWRDGGQIPVRGAKRRALLAILVLHANEVVRTDRLIDELWGESPPRTAVASLHNHVSRLRKELGQEVVVTRPWGYVLRTDPETIDLNRFQTLVSTAQPMPAEARAARLREALALWRGSPLTDLGDEPALRHDIDRLEDMHVDAVEQRIEADLELGRNGELVPELEALVAAHPLRERLRGLLILALYRAGRQAEALETYRETRRVLTEELGIEPSSELRELERAILRQDPSLAHVETPESEPEGPHDPPRGRSWGRSALLVTLALLLAGVGAVAAFLIAGRDGGSVPVAHASPKQSFSSTAETQPAGTGGGKDTTVSATTGHKKAGGGPVSPHGRSKPSTLRSTTSDTSAGTGEEPALGDEVDLKSTSGSSTGPSTAAGGSTTAKPVVKAPYRLADDFDDPEFNSDMWHRAMDGEGWGFAERLNRLEISLAADSTPAPPWDVVEGHYGTQCQLLGDFDARVDFELLKWPEANGGFMYMGAYLGPGTPATPAIERFSMPWSEGYLAFFSADSSEAIPGDEVRGSLRLRRRGGDLAMFVRRRGQWLKLGSGTARGPVIIVLQLAGSGAYFIHKEVAVGYDNFVAEADDVSCPPGTPMPPRKR